jgi:hypothetical protein
MIVAAGFRGGGGRVELLLLYVVVFLRFHPTRVLNRQTLVYFW